MLLSTAHRSLVGHAQVISKSCAETAAWKSPIWNVVRLKSGFSRRSFSSSFRHHYHCGRVRSFTNASVFCRSSLIDFGRKGWQWVGGNHSSNHRRYLETQQQHQRHLPHPLHYSRRQQQLLIATPGQPQLFVRGGFTAESLLHILLVRTNRSFTTTSADFLFTNNYYSSDDNDDCVTNTMEKKKVCIVGSGNWGSAIAKIIGNNVRDGNEEFHSTINMYVYEEMYEGRKLSEIINQEHENKKYLPGIKLPDNVVAVTDLATAADGADILVFVVPHQFIRSLCKQLDGRVKEGALAVSLIKGLDVKDGGGLLLISDVITECLSIPCHVLMGANLAGEVAGENYCEATVGAQDIHQGLMLKRLLQTKYFRLVVVQDAVTVEICGALKNIVAVGAGFADGLGYGDNTKAAVIRLGLMEMIKFVDSFYEGTKPATFLESCGVADLVTTCYGGRNRRVAEAMVKTGKTLEQLEKEMLNGQKLQGPPTAAEVNVMLKAKNMEDTFPIFVAIHEICEGKRVPAELKEVLCHHPVHAMDTDQPYMRHFYGTVQDLTTDRCSYFEKQ